MKQAAYSAAARPLALLIPAFIALDGAAPAGAARIVDAKPVDPTYAGARAKTAALGAYATTIAPQSILFAVQGTRDWDFLARSARYVGRKGFRYHAGFA